MRRANRVITAEDLARMLHEEFERDSWGNVDPYLFEAVAGSVADPTLLDPQECDHAEGTIALREMLRRVVARFHDPNPKR